MAKITTRQLPFWVVFLIPVLLIAEVKETNIFENNQSFDNWAQTVNAIRFESPDSAIHLYQLSYEYCLKQKDTLAAIKSLVEIATVNGHQGRYQVAYDHLWKALLLADMAKDQRGKFIAYINLGRYYSFYKRKEKAIEYFQHALDTGKAMVAKGAFQDAHLVEAYYALCSTYRELLNPILGQIYLDSCFLFYNPEVNGSDLLPFLNFESAFLNATRGQYQEALDTMLAVEPLLEQFDPGYRVLLFTYIGDIYLEINKILEGETYYEKALMVSQECNSHLDFTPTIYQRLSDLYLKKGDYQKAFSSLQMVRELNSQFFDSRSKNNRSLLEIKDEFRVEKEKQKQLIQQQRLRELEHEEREILLKNALLMVGLIFLLLIGIIYFNYIRNKHRAEKELIQKKQELEVKQAQELLELKNRELAASSLKLIEKDEILATLKEKLSKGNGEIKADALRKIVRSISHSNAQNWEEFEARFISVNKGFYERLNKNHPKLSRGEQKLCALVKLNLSSKEMSKLLGISIESVHTNRYRLRKKLKLERETSLTEFIAKL